VSPGTAPGIPADERRNPTPLTVASPAATASSSAPGRLHTARRRPHPARLYHFTCKHSERSIIAVGALVPAPHPFLPWAAPMVWLTTDPRPTRIDVGLTSDFIDCDRMARRFRVILPGVARRWLDLCDTAPPDARDTIEMLNRGRRPETWWVSTVAVPVVPA
jgi:hypothetical protein